mmetsp:Transcript_12579/g.23703  ORF Transcript_12579/g.23703 Transcript_12579/m.23703 type:complete len:350 (-) Transcript_12579:179-1228(-)
MILFLVRLETLISNVFFCLLQLSLGSCLSITMSSGSVVVTCFACTKGFRKNSILLVRQEMLVPQAAQEIRLSILQVLFLYQVPPKAMFLEGLPHSLGFEFVQRLLSQLQDRSLHLVALASLQAIANAKPELLLCLRGQIVLMNEIELKPITTDRSGKKSILSRSEQLHAIPHLECPEIDLLLNEIAVQAITLLQVTHQGFPGSSKREKIPIHIQEDARKNLHELSFHHPARRRRVPSTCFHIEVLEQLKCLALTVLPVCIQIAKRLKQLLGMDLYLFLQFIQLALTKVSNLITRSSFFSSATTTIAHDGREQLDHRRLVRCWARQYRSQWPWPCCSVSTTASVLRRAWC